MATHSMLVFTRPVAGRDDEYNRWYNEQHLHDVLKVPGVVAAQRFRPLPGQDGDDRYLAIYEFDTPDPSQVLAQLTTLAGTAAMPMSDALDMATISMVVYEGICDRIENR